MLLKVKKQIEETVEFKTPAYYKDYIGNFHHVNEDGQLVSVRTTGVSMWEPNQGKYYTEEIETLLTRGAPCSKEDFDKAYIEVMSKFENATTVQL